MRKFLSFVARFIAVILATFFVITTLLAIFLTTVNHLMDNAEPVKKALVEQDVYSRLPEIVGSALTDDNLRNPCAQNPLACSMDGASPELQACLTNALGLAAYEEIGSTNRIPTDLELSLAQPCLDQFGTPAVENLLLLRKAPPVGCQPSFKISSQRIGRRSSQFCSLLKNCAP